MPDNNKIEVLATQTMTNVVAWLTDNDTAYDAIEAYYPADTAVADKHKLAPVIAMMHVAAKVGGLPSSGEQDVAAQLEAQLQHFSNQQIDPKRRQDLMDHLRGMVPRLAAKVLLQLHGLQRPGVPLSDLGFVTVQQIPQREHDVVRDLAIVTAVYLRQLLVAYPRGIPEVLRCLRSLHSEDDSDSNASADTAGGGKVYVASQVLEQLGQLQIQVREQQAARDNQLELMRRSIERQNAELADAKARASAAEQIAEAAEAKAAAADKRAAAAERAVAQLARCGGGGGGASYADQLGERVEAVEQRLSKAEAAAAKAGAAHASVSASVSRVLGRLSSAERSTGHCLALMTRATTEAEEAKQRMLVAADAYSKEIDTFQSKMDQVMARLDSPDDTSPSRVASSVDDMRAVVARLQAEVAWLMPQVQQQFCDRWNSVMMQWQLQQRLSTPHVQGPQLSVDD